MNAVLKPTPIVNLTAARIRKQVERAAYLQAHIRAATEELDGIKALFRRAGDGEYLGSAHRLVVATSHVTRLDLALVKSRLTPAEYLACCATSDVTRVLVQEV